VTLDPFVRWAAKPARLTVESNTTHDLAVGNIFLSRNRARQPASRIRPLSTEKVAWVPASYPRDVHCPPSTQAAWASTSALSGRFASTVIEDVASLPNRVSRCALRSEHTEARNDILGCFGRSDRSAQGDRP
jgi:hypothetical protein